MCDANASTKGSQPFGDATCDESMRKRGFSVETSEEAEGGGEKKRKKDENARGKYRAGPFHARGDSRGRYVAGIRVDFPRGLLARRGDVGAFYRDADIPQIHRGNGVLSSTARQYRGRRNTASRERRCFVTATLPIHGRGLRDVYWSRVLKTGIS